MLSCGDTFLIPKSSSETEHLWVVVTEPDPETGDAVCVSITTRRANSDITVILRPNHHPFIKYDSVVFYSDAQIVNMHDVQRALDAQTSEFVCVRHVSCAAEVLQNNMINPVAAIQHGILNSKMTPNKVKRYCRKVWGIDP